MNTRTTGSLSRLSRRLLIFVWAALLMGAAGAKAEPVKTMVQDTLYRADGSVAHGKVSIRWSGFSTSVGEAVPAGAECSSSREFRWVMRERGTGVSLGCALATAVLGLLAKD